MASRGTAKDEQDLTWSGGTNSEFGPDNFQRSFPVKIPTTFYFLEASTQKSWKSLRYPKRKVLMTVVILTTTCEESELMDCACHK